MADNSRLRIGLIFFISVLVIALSIILFNLAKAVQIGNQRERFVWQGGSSGAPLTLAAAYQSARERAQTWAPDVQLVRAESTWHPQENWQTVENPPVVWSFVFWSAKQMAIATASVDGETVYWVQPRPVPGTPARIQGNAFPPATDVDVVWFSLLGAGGNQFLEAHPGAMVHFALQADKENPELLVWLAQTMTRDDGGGYLEVTLDAQTGKVINSVSSQ